jgi:serine/threonine-protein kinase
MNTGATPTRKKARVLCVDDEPNILRSLRWLLQKDFEVEVAASGYDGLELLRQGEYDVVISDQRMPGMIGSDFLREVRKVSPRSMRILLTGYSDPQSILKSVNESEVFRFVNKPWQFQELLKVVGDAARIARDSPVTAPAVEPAPDEPVEMAGEAILVIDDDEDARRQIAEAIGPVTTLLYARDLAEALLAMEQPVGIIVANMRVGGVDATRMIKLLKQQHPDIVALVYTDATDSVDVISLINQAQVFRFMPKPVKPTTLRMALSAATLKRRALQADPSARRRHTVEALDAAERQSLLADVQRVAQARPQGRTADGGSLLGRLGGGLKRLFGMAD